MPAKFLKTYHRVLDWIKAFSHVAFVIRFSIAMSLLAGIALRLADQSLEALRVLAAHDSAQFWPRIFFIIAALFLSLLSWYCARVLLYLIDPLPKAKGEVERAKKFWIRQLPRIVGALPLLFTAWALLAAARSDAVEDNAGRLRMLAVFCLIATFVLYVFFHFRRWLSARMKGRKPGTVADHALVEGAILPGVSNLAKSGKIVLVLSLSLWVVLLLLFTFGRQRVVEMAILFGPLAILLLFAAIWIPVGSALVYAGNLTRLPLFLILVICAFSFSAADWNDNHLVRYISVPGQTKPMDINEGFKQWLSGRCDRDNYKNSDGKSEYPVFIVSAEGGGLRAAYFASLILTKLQDENPAFAHHVFGISGVSGGSLGGAVFAALARNYVKHDDASPCNFRMENLPEMAEDKQSKKRYLRILNDQILGNDILSPILASLLYPDLLQRFLFFPVQRFDRSRAAEDALGYYWNRATGGDEFYKNFYLYDLYQDRVSHQSTFATQSTPALFLNVTRVETGEQLVVSSLNPNGPDEERNKRLNGLKSLADFDPTLSLPLGTAAYLSARFPVVASAGYLPLPDGKGGSIKARFIDGGYFENSGTATVLDLLSAMRLKEVAEAEKIGVRIIIIRIGTDPGELQYKEQGLGEITSPIFGLLNTRTARGTLSTLEMRTALAQLGDQNSKGQGNAPGELEQAIAQRIEVSEPGAEFGLRAAEQAHFQVNEKARVQANETKMVKLPLGYLLSKEAREFMNWEIGSVQQCTPGAECNYDSFKRVLEVLQRR